MTKASDNLFPSVLFDEQGSDPSGLSAGTWRVYAKAGGIYIVDDADAVTGPLGTGGSGAVATDPIWDAAGDLAVGTGADTAAKLTKGNAGGYLAMGNGAVIWNAGTSFPGSKATGDRYWRTDLGLEFYWDGTRWVTTTLFEAPITPTSMTALVATTTLAAYQALDNPLSYWVESFFVATNVGSGTPSTQYWTIGLYKSTAAAATTLLGSGVSTQNDTYAQWNIKRETIGAAVDPSAHPLLRVDVTKVSTPGLLTWRPGYRFRLIAT